MSQFTNRNGRENFWRGDKPRDILNIRRGDRSTGICFLPRCRGYDPEGIKNPVVYTGSCCFTAIIFFFIRTTQSEDFISFAVNERIAFTDKVIRQAETRPRLTRFLFVSMYSNKDLDARLKLIALFEIPYYINLLSLLCLLYSAIFPLRASPNTWQASTTNYLFVKSNWHVS